jgi:hypothetical protein
MEYGKKQMGAELMPDPVTTAAIALKLGGGLLGWRRGKQEEAKRARQEAMNKLIGSLSQRQQPNQQQQMQDRSRPGVLETLATDPNLAMLLSKHLSSRPRPKPRNPFGIDPYK